MPNDCIVIDHENVNGVQLSLKMECRSSSNNSQKFIISYKNKNGYTEWPIELLILSILFNMLACCYMPTSLFAFLFMGTILLMSVFFWITHSVKSETLHFIPTVGMHSSVKYIFGREDFFVPCSTIDDFTINEVIESNQVVLCMLLKTGNSSRNDSTTLIPLFKNTKPKLIMLEKIHTELKVLLTISKSQVAVEGSGDKNNE